jgi:hypothetical protein
MKQRWSGAERRLVDGLTEYERIARLEAIVLGRKQRLGLEERVETLESDQRRRAMPFWIRWFVRAK